MSPPVGVLATSSRCGARAARVASETMPTATIEDREVHALHGRLMPEAELSTVFIGELIWPDVGS